ncbi:arylsulfatase [Reichenbachiella carrageenanivorans]|uniref:Arylsulfatase n=1 Tax=Reichenbachiella carrageenanivorans TaxID=2979869 RepID=A0ABY6D799_9BACT|nr:arylsulfatase [Reichenbachiella carrageenanivorans]UXX81018.1 arylsulfatase [Reichenbachiella carrageenanivorans]
MKYQFLYLLCFLASCTSITSSPPSSKPNVIVILADDLGYGDISSHQTEGQIYTPVLDSLARSGYSFTNAHTNSSVCTPSRYALLTGRYSWRSKLKSGVLFGYDLPLIEDDRHTLGKLFQNNGYRTAHVGKWHLGLPWQLNPQSDYKERTADSIYHQLLAKPADVLVEQPLGQAGWQKQIGFDQFYGISASLDIPPYGMIDQGQFTLPLSDSLEASEHVASYDKDFWRAGIATPGFEPKQVFRSIVDAAKAFISKDEKPFFMYMALTAPHTPWLPEEQFRGTSNAGKYGDFLSMVDWSVGEVLGQLKAAGELDNTIVIFTSDNGAALHGIEAYGGNGHLPNGILRGQKGDLYEGGHRVPLIVSWPDHIISGTSGDLVLLSDIMATLTDVVGDELPSEVEDSHSFYPLLVGAEFEPRTEAVYHSQIGSFAIQSGPWKYIDIIGSGGFSKPRLVEPQEGQPSGQLYNLEKDPAEQVDRYLSHPEIVNDLKARLDEYRKSTQILNN